MEAVKFLEQFSVIKKSNVEDLISYAEEKEYQNIDTLTREAAFSLIREVKVTDKNHIEVVFDFDDSYRECLQVISEQGNSVTTDENGKLNIRLKEAV